VLLTIHPILVPRSWKSRALTLPTLWTTTGPVTGTHFTSLCSVYPAPTVATFPWMEVHNDAPCAFFCCPLTS